MVFAGCFVVSPNDASENPFDELSSACDAWFDREGRLIFSIEAHAIGRLLPVLPKPWVEIGVGSGRFGRALGIGLGLDPSVKLLEMARDRGISAFLGDGERCPFVNGCFGSVFLVVTLCFVNSPLAVLSEAHRILADNGRLVIGLVLRDSPWGKYYRRKAAEGHRFYRHAKFYSYDEVAAPLEQSGFEIEKAVSTLFQAPGEVSQMGSPRNGHSPDAGFTVILAGES